MIRRTVLEWETIAHGDGPTQIPAHAADRIAAAAAASLHAGRSGDGVLEHRRRGLRAKSIVGVVAADGCLVEILPKIEVDGQEGLDATGAIRSRLVHMIAVALDLKIDVGQVTALQWQRETLLEILIKIFSERLVDALRHGMPRRYVHHADDLPLLRGRLDTTRQFTKLAAEPSRLACVYDALSPDIALNQIMKAAVVQLARMSATVSNQRRLRELAFVYGDISDLPVSALRWSEVVLDRTNARWRSLLELARLLLGGRFQTTSAGGGAGYSLLFDMNALFEEYVARMLRRALAGTELSVVTQGGRLYCLERPDGRGLFQTRPDILIKRGSEVVQVIDTKWKRIGDRVDDPKQGVSQSDVYQMMAYGQLYDCERLTLLYPHHAGMGRKEGVQETNQVTGCKYRLEAATVDIGRPYELKIRLRSIVDPLGWA